MTDTPLTAEERTDIRQRVVDFAYTETNTAIARNFYVCDVPTLINALEAAERKLAAERELAASFKGTHLRIRGQGETMIQIPVGREYSAIVDDDYTYCEMERSSAPGGRECLT